MKKLLCVCQQGNIRSVALARLLKSEGNDTIACGVNANSQETLKMLCEWADKVLVVENSLANGLPKGFEDKIVQMNIGGDIWNNTHHPDLELVVRNCYYAKKANIWN